MVTVQGFFKVLPEERARFLDARRGVIENSRNEDGCQEYALTPDPIDPGRIVVSERWDSMDHLQRHLDAAAALAAEPGYQPLPQPIGAEITAYEISTSRRLR